MFGFQSKTGLILDPCQGGSEGPSQVPSQGGSQGPSVQEKGEEKEKGKEVDSVPIKKSATNSKRDLFLEMYNEVRKSKLTKARVVKTWTDKAKRNFAKVLTKEYTKNQIKGAIVAAFEDKHHIDTIYQYLTVEFLTREDILERYVMAHDAGLNTNYSMMDNQQKAMKFID